jgi:hypothetical protein
MPLDQSFNYYYHRFHWYEKFAWWPQKCMVTGKRIWFERAMKGVQLITGPGDPVIILKWMDKKQFLFEKLKGTI